MTPKKIIEADIAQLVPDDVNFNKGTQFGQSLIEKSLRQFGAGRSILLDKNNRIIAGNKTVENAGQIGLEKVLIVETTGEEIVAVKRTDIDLDTREGRELALADNATGAANLAWDEAALTQASDKWDIAPDDWGVELEGYGGEGGQGEEDTEEQLRRLKDDFVMRLVGNRHKERGRQGRRFDICQISTTACLLRYQKRTSGNLGAGTVYR